MRGALPFDNCQAHSPKNVVRRLPGVMCRQEHEIKAKIKSEAVQMQLQYTLCIQ